MNKFKNYRAITTFVSFVLVVIAVFLVSSLVRPVQCSQDDPQCQFLKEKIKNPRDNREKNNHNFYCNEMQRLKCSEYASLCGDPPDSSPEATALGTWKGTYRNSKSQSGTSSMSFSKSANGKITGTEDGVPIEDVTIAGNVVSFKYKLSGCRTVEGRLAINADGKTASGSYTVTECNGTDKYTGNYIDYEKQ